MSYKPSPRVIYETLKSGDPMTDTEINFGVKYYKDLADKLIDCGPVFWLSFVEANRIYMRLYEFQQARKKKK